MIKMQQNKIWWEILQKYVELDVELSSESYENTSDF
jgi:hypothetical protein